MTLLTVERESFPVVPSIKSNHSFTFLIPSFISCTSTLNGLWSGGSHQSPALTQVSYISKILQCQTSCLNHRWSKSSGFMLLAQALCKWKWSYKLISILFAFIWNFSSFGAISFKSFRTTSRSPPTAAVSASTLPKVPSTQLLPSLLPSFALFSDISASPAARISSVVYCCCLLNLLCLKLTKTKRTHSVTLAHQKKMIQSDHICLCSSEIFESKMSGDR